MLRSRRYVLCAGDRIWGRGSSDDKSGLIGIMSVTVFTCHGSYLMVHRSAIESLLAKGFKPTRTFVLAFGFDEEASGREVCLDMKYPWKFIIHAHINRALRALEKL